MNVTLDTRSLSVPLMIRNDLASYSRFATGSSAMLQIANGAAWNAYLDSVRTHGMACPESGMQFPISSAL